MIFHNKLDRAMDWLSEQKSNVKETEHIDLKVDVDFKTDRDLENENKKHGRYKHSEFEKKDLTALFISAFLIFVPAIVIILGIFILLAWLMF
jgi:hypothetical protein